MHVGRTERTDRNMQNTQSKIQSLAPVSLTMAVLAVLVAVVTLLGHRAHTEEVVLQATASDQWAYYQAKNIRRHEDEIFSRPDLRSGHHGRCRAGQIAREILQAKLRATKMNRKEIEDKASEMEAEVGTRGIAPIDLTWPKFSWKWDW